MVTLGPISTSLNNHELFILIGHRFAKSAHSSSFKLW